MRAEYHHLFGASTFRVLSQQSLRGIPSFETIIPRFRLLVQLGEMLMHNRATGSCNRIVQQVPHHAQALISACEKGGRLDKALQVRKPCSNALALALHKWCQFYQLKASY